MKLVLTVLIFFSVSVFAKRASIPEPREVIAAQFACDAKKIQSWPWEIHYKEKTPFIKLAYKVTAIVKDFKVTEYEPKRRKGEGKDPKKELKSVTNAWGYCVVENL